ncbi:MAG: NUDIX hydrolase [Gammaproteobacteria bacterium]|nr:MAG: NUDIX hydrolase [Gammaproteobacteria bacterium]
MTGVEPKPAATLLTLREVETKQGKELQVFMIVRHKKIDFASGALVFPGGKVAENDYGVIRKHCIQSDQFDDTELALRIAAIRETFEESGLLFAYQSDQDHYIQDNEQAHLKEYRKAINAKETTFSEFVQDQNLRLAVNELTPFAHWVTPKMVPKRFDTHFYITPAPATQVASPDGHESVDAIWIEPNHAVQQGEEGKLTVIFPTRMNLQKLGNQSTIKDSLASAQREPIVTVEPWTEVIENKTYMCIPKEAGYSTHQFPMESIMKP